MARLEVDSRAISSQGPMGILVRQIMVGRLGKDPNICELCGKTGKMDIHHRKYDGATLYDLVFACRSCNLLPENKGLK